MLKEIARNKRRSVIVVVLFVLVWAGIGLVIFSRLRAAPRPSTDGAAIHG